MQVFGRFNDVNNQSKWLHFLVHPVDFLVAGLLYFPCSPGQYNDTL